MEPSHTQCMHACMAGSHHTHRTPNPLDRNTSHRALPPPPAKKRSAVAAGDARVRSVTAASAPASTCIIITGNNHSVY